MGRRVCPYPRLYCGCSSVVEHLLAKERVESSNLFIRLFPFIGQRVIPVSLFVLSISLF